MYAACSARRLTRRPSPTRRTFSKRPKLVVGHGGRGYRLSAAPIRRRARFRTVSSRFRHDGGGSSGHETAARLARASLAGLLGRCAGACSHPAARSRSRPGDGARRHAPLGRLRGRRDARPRGAARTCGSGTRRRAASGRSGADDPDLQGRPEHRERHLAGRDLRSACLLGHVRRREHPRVRPVDGDADALGPAPSRRGVERRRLRRGRSSSAPGRARASRTPSATTITYVADDGRRLFRVSVGSPVRLLAAGIGPGAQRVVASLADGRVVVLSTHRKRDPDDRVRARDGDRGAARAAGRDRADRRRRSRRRDHRRPARRREPPRLPPGAARVREGVSGAFASRRDLRGHAPAHDSRPCPAGSRSSRPTPGARRGRTGTSVSWRGGPLP